MFMKFIRPRIYNRWGMLVSFNNYFSPVPQVHCFGGALPVSVLNDSATTAAGILHLQMMTASAKIYGALDDQHHRWPILLPPIYTTTGYYPNGDRHHWRLLLTPVATANGLHYHRCYLPPLSLAPLTEPSTSSQSWESELFIIQQHIWWCSHTGSICWWNCLKWRISY